MGYTEDTDTAWHRERGPQPPVQAVVVCTPTVLNPVTAACLEQYAPHAAIRHIRPADKYGMWQHLADHWDNPKPLVHVDHDMVFVYDNLASLADCTEDWCVCPAWSLGAYVTLGLGLVKFSPALRARVTMGMVREAMDACEQCHGMWWHVEHHLGMLLIDAGYTRHQHEDVLHDHTDLLKRHRLSPTLDISVPAGGVTYVKDYYQEAPGG
jgi:hypothetical protein